MTINELMVRHNFISKVLLKEGDKELSKDLKVKVMSMRIKMGKVRKEFEEDLQEAIKQLTPDGYTELSMKETRTSEEADQLKEWNAKINDEYNIYATKRGKEETSIEATLTEDEFAEIVEVNAGNDTEINGVKVCASDFLEVLYSLFVG